MGELNNIIERSAKAKLHMREGRIEYWNAVIADWELSGLKQQE